MDVNPDRLNAFIGKMLGDVGAAMNASLMLIGDKLGLYKTLSEKGPFTSTELAQATDTSERYVREWLAAQAASGYVEYDAATGKFSMTPEQTMVFGDEDSPVFMGAVGSLVRRRCLTNRKFPRRSRPARASAGTGAANVCSAAPPASSAPATSIIWCRSGCPPSMASSKSWSAAPRSPMSAADTVCRRG